MNPSDSDPGPTPRVTIVSNTDCFANQQDYHDKLFDPKVDFIPEYEIFNLIGEGGFGRVYRARQIKLDRFVALKIIAAETFSIPNTSKRFETEAHLLAKLHHPNIVRIYDFGRTSKFMYLAMELLEGEDFASRLMSVGQLGEWETWWVIRQAAAGLAHASTLGIVHRDIKPANLFFTKAPMGSHLPEHVPNVTVMDFGLALVKWNPNDTTRSNVTGIALGTPAYMAPEQHQTMDVDLRADIYALGATAYHALTGKLPFQGGTIWDVIAKKLDRTPRSLPFGQEHSAKLIAAMMEPNVASRIQTYESLIQQIDQLLAQSEKKQSEIQAELRWRKRRKAIMIITMVVFSFLSFATIKYVVRKRPINIPVPPYHSTGLPKSFFDGKSLNDWIIQDGLNEIEVDEEKNPVLSVSGLIKHAIPDLKDFRLTFGVDIFEAHAAEIQMYNMSLPDMSQHFVIRITKEEGAVFGIRQGLKGELHPIGRSIAFPSKNWLKDRRPYLEIRLEQTGNVWSAWFHGELLGRTVVEENNMNQILILGENGRAHLDTILWERMEPDAK